MQLVVLRGGKGLGWGLVEQSGRRDGLARASHGRRDVSAVDDLRHQRHRVGKVVRQVAALAPPPPLLGIHVVEGDRPAPLPPHRRLADRVGAPVGVEAGWRLLLQDVWPLHLRRREQPKHLQLGACRSTHAREPNPVEELGVHQVLGAGLVALLVVVLRLRVIADAPRAPAAPHPAQVCLVLLERPHDLAEQGLGRGALGGRREVARLQRLPARGARRRHHIPLQHALGQHQPLAVAREGPFPPPAHEIRGSSTCDAERGVQKGP